jgi:hypothetical protein
MNCCGQRRKASQRLATANNKLPAPKMTRIAYLGQKHITLFSSAGMRSYTFSPSQRIQMVNAPDAELLLRRRDFRRQQ